MALLCQCHGNHREFLYRLDDSLMRDLTFIKDKDGWESRFRSMAAKARDNRCPFAIVEALEAAEVRLGISGAWCSHPEWSWKLRCLGIHWRLRTKCKPENCLALLGCNRCKMATEALTILTNQDHCRRFLKTFHDIDKRIILPAPPPPAHPPTQKQTEPGLPYRLAAIGPIPPPPPGPRPPPTGRQRSPPPPPPPGWLPPTQLIFPPPPPPTVAPPQQECNYDALRMQQLVEVSDVGTGSGDTSGHSRSWPWQEQQLALADGDSEEHEVGDDDDHEVDEENEVGDGCSSDAQDASMTPTDSCCSAIAAARQGSEMEAVQ